eukprot:1941558-Pyramimonas_sp.AAC.1
MSRSVTPHALAPRCCRASIVSQTRRLANELAKKNRASGRLASRFRFAPKSGRRLPSVTRAGDVRVGPGFPAVPGPVPHCVPARLNVRSSLRLFLSCAGQTVAQCCS